MTTESPSRILSWQSRSFLMNPIWETTPEWGSDSPTFLLTLPASQSAACATMLCHAPKVPSSLGPFAPRPLRLQAAHTQTPHRLQLDLSHLGPNDAVYPVWSTCTRWLALDLAVLYGYSLNYLTAQMMTETDLGGVERGAEYLCRVCRYITPHDISYPILVSVSGVLCLYVVQV